MPFEPSLEDAIEILARLVAFDTVSERSNLALIDYVRDHLAGLGVASELIESPDGAKANLFATIGPREGGGIGLSGHTDVVPVEGQSWQSDPFTLTRRGDRLYGRGACDMKGFLACALAAVPLFQAQPLRRPIHLLFSYDEEVGCMGVIPMVAELGKRLPKPAMVIVGEPTSMQVVDAHKGAARYHTRITGREAHSSMAHLGVNAIHCAAQLIAHMREIEAALETPDIARRFAPPRTTLHVGRIEGGTALNIVPRTCAFEWEVRPLPGVHASDIVADLERFAAEQVLPAMHAVDPDTGIETAIVNDIPAFLVASDAEVVSLARSLSGRNETRAVSYMTEAPRFQEGGLEAVVVCGPGDIAQAHAPDEFIAISEIERCLGFMARLARWAAA